MTQKRLGELSGIAVGTISKIEGRKKDYKIHEDTARDLAKALDIEVHDIFDVGELSIRGRPPKTGRPIRVTVSYEGIRCPRCFIITPDSASKIATECDFCGCSFK